MYQFSIVRNFACVQTPRLKAPPVGSVQPGRRSPPAKFSHPVWWQINGLGASRFCSRHETPIPVAALLSIRVRSGGHGNGHGPPTCGPNSESRSSLKLVLAAGLATGMHMEESAAKAVAESAEAGAFTRSRRVVVSVGGRWWRRRGKSDGPIPVVLVRPVPVLSIGPCGDAAEDTQHQEQESHQPALPSSIPPRRPCRGSANGRVIATSVPPR